MSTWPWSHTMEAVEDLRLNLRDMPEDELRVIYAEWLATRWLSYGPDFDLGYYDTVALPQAESIDHGTLCRRIWNSMSDYEHGRRCTPGGFYALACPYGCSHHLVSFLPQGKDRDHG